MLNQQSTWPCTTKEVIWYFTLWHHLLAIKRNAIYTYKRLCFPKNESEEAKNTLLLGSNFSAFLKVWMASVYSPCKASTLNENK